MAKKITGYIKLQCPAGKATPSPPVGPALGQHGVNIMAFVKEFNARTASHSGRVTPVNALAEAAARGLVVAETVGGDGDGFDRLLKLRVSDGNRSREIEATLHRGPRVVRLDGVEIEFDPQSHVLLLRNEDRPGMVGAVGSKLGELGINIVNFALGAAGDGQARAAITVDRALDETQLANLRAMPGVLSLAQA